MMAHSNDVSLVIVVTASESEELVKDEIVLEGSVTMVSGLDVLFRRLFFSMSLTWESSKLSGMSGKEGVKAGVPGVPLRLPVDPPFVLRFDSLNLRESLDHGSAGGTPSASIPISAWRVDGRVMITE